MGLDDPVQPAREGIGVLQLMQLPIHLEERVLGDILRLVGIAHRSIRVIHDHRLEPTHQFGKGPVSCLFIG